MFMDRITVRKARYICIMFFMVLDLRLTKRLRLSWDNLFCFYTVWATFL